MNKYINEILVITDNPQIAKRFEKEVWCLVDKNVFGLTFMCSPFSILDNFKLENEIRKVDLRDSGEIERLKKYSLILSIHCKQIFPPELVNSVRCVNIHPGYNPINRGWYPQVFSIINDTIIGATIHEIDRELDHGNIIDREKVKKYNFDTSLTLYNRIIDKEIELLKKNIHSILSNSYTSYKPENEGNIYLKKHFDQICELDLSEKMTVKELIDRLRALTHGAYKNAFFFDGNKKVYVSINLENEH